MDRPTRQSDDAAAAAAAAEGLEKIDPEPAAGLPGGGYAQMGGKGCHEGHFFHRREIAPRDRWRGDPPAGEPCTSLGSTKRRAVEVGLSRFDTKSIILNANPSFV